MSTNEIYGGWDTKRTGMGALNIDPQDLWHMLAAQNVGRADFQPNNGLSQRKNEIIELWQLFARQAPRVVLEVGTAQGGTFASWCMLARSDATLISIDRCQDDCLPRPGEPVNPEVGNHMTGLRGVFALARGSQTIHAINGWTYNQSTKEALWQALAGRKVDFLFHDASHQSDMFAEDFKWMWPLIAEGGVFASHDVPPSSDPKCNKVDEWRRIKREETYSACYEWLPHPSMTEMGIGALLR